MSVLDSLIVTPLNLDENSSPITLNELRSGRYIIVDFWHTKCVKCPAALEKLNEEAAESAADDVIFVSCALSQGPGNKEVACDVVAGYVEQKVYELQYSNVVRSFLDLGVNLNMFLSDPYT